MKALFIVDMQYEFVDHIPAIDFNLLVKTILTKIDTYIEKDLPIITTMDVHSEENHFEFEKHGEHCLDDSYKVDLVMEIRKKLKDYHKWYNINKNSYSVFMGESEEQADNLITNLNIEKAEVCGVLTSICVLNLVLDLSNRCIPVNIIPYGTFDFEDYNKKAIIIMKKWAGVTFE